MKTLPQTNGAPCDPQLHQQDILGSQREVGGDGGRWEKMGQRKLIVKGQKKSRRNSNKNSIKGKHDNLSTKQHSTTNSNSQTIKEQTKQNGLEEEREPESMDAFCQRGQEQKVKKDVNSKLPSNSDERTDKIVEYCEEIYEHLGEKEVGYVPSPIKNPEEINDQLRGKIIEWIFNICKALKFKFQTGFLAVNLLDRFLGKVGVEKKNLQLLAVTVIFMAAKYQEVTIPKLTYFTSIPTDTVKITRANILAFQAKIIMELNFDFGFVSPVTFINLIGHKFNVGEQDRRKSIEMCKEVIMSPSSKYWRSSYLAWYSLYYGCRELKELHQFVRKNSNIQTSSY